MDNDTQQMHVQNQVDLSFRTALAIVIQGFRIRLGRSLVTIFGVVLGIAFLMSNLTNQTVKQAVRDEEQARSQVRRMVSFLAAETGPIAGKTLGVIQDGPLGRVETRFLAKLQADGLSGLRWYASHNAPPADLPHTMLQPVDLADIAEGSSALVLMGTGSPGKVLFDSFANGLPGIPVAATGVQSAPLPDSARVSIVQLLTEPTEEERQRAAHQAHSGRVRKIWILTISVLVTVMGIANAMLMSVTERFREIGTMKCLGAKSSFIRRLFLIESSLVGLVGGVLGACAGAAFSLLINCSVYGLTVLTSVDIGSLVLAGLASVAAGVVLAIIAAINPANVAASMTPSHALRANV